MGLRLAAGECGLSWVEEAEAAAVVGGGGGLRVEEGGGVCESGHGFFRVRWKMRYGGKFW